MPGTYNVKVVPTGATTPVVIEANLTLEAGKDYTVAAVNVLARMNHLSWLTTMPLRQLVTLTCALCTLRRMPQQWILPWQAAQCSSPT